MFVDLLLLLFLVKNENRTPIFRSSPANTVVIIHDSNHSIAMELLEAIFAGQYPAYKL